MAPSLDVAVRLLVSTVLFSCLWPSYVVGQSEEVGVLDAPSISQQRTKSEPAVEACNSLTGPFCAFTDSLALYTPYMTPISSLGLQREDNKASQRSAKTDEGVPKWQRKKCFFQHFPSSWMDSGGDAYDLLNQQVANVDECEKLCCEHAECQSFTFWRGRTCFLRTQSNTPRQDGGSFSGIRLS